MGEGNGTHLLPPEGQAIAWMLKICLSASETAEYCKGHGSNHPVTETTGNALVHWIDPMRNTMP